MLNIGLFVGDALICGLSTMFCTRTMIGTGSGKKGHSELVQLHSTHKKQWFMLVATAGTVHFPPPPPHTHTHTHFAHASTSVNLIGQAH